MTTHSSTLAWKTPWIEEPGKLESTESQSHTQLSNFTSHPLDCQGTKVYFWKLCWLQEHTDEGRTRPDSRHTRASTNRCGLNHITDSLVLPQCPRHPTLQRGNIPTAPKRGLDHCLYTETTWVTGNDRALNEVLNNYRTKQTSPLGLLLILGPVCRQSPGLMNSALGIHHQSKSPHLYPLLPQSHPEDFHLNTHLLVFLQGLIWLEIT